MVKVGAGTLALAGVTLIAPPAASASSNCSAGGTCFFQDNNYTSASWRNTSGVDTSLGDNYYTSNGVSVNNTSSAWADSTTSSSFTGVDAFDGTFCTNKVFWLLRGGQFAVPSSSHSYNDRISSFKLSVSGTTTTC
jgi:hypothetical protein